MAGVEGFAIEEEGVVGFGAGDDELVHDATGDTGESMFGCLAELDCLEFGELLAGEFFEQATCGDLEGSTAAEAAPEGEVSGDDSLKAGQGDVAFLKSGEDALDIVGPGGFAGLEWVGESEAGRLVLSGRDEGDFGLAGVFGGDEHMALDGHGHDEAVVIIHVFADEVYPAWGGHDDFGVGLEVLLEAAPGLLEQAGAAVDGQAMGWFRTLG
jgi:hypothetical protein